MPFQLKASFSVAFDVDPEGDDGVQTEIQGKICDDKIMPSLVSQVSSQPLPIPGVQHQTSSVKSKQEMQKSEEFQPTSTPMTTSDTGAETKSAKAKDRESLKLLLRATSHTGTVRAAGGKEAISGRSTAHLLVQHVPAANSSSKPNDSFMSGLPINLPYDSGSDLVSSLQRLRVRGLASYFEKMERIAALRSSRSSAGLIHEGVERDIFGIVKEVDETEEVELNEDENGRR
jgi:hypothetical protein